MPPIIVHQSKEYSQDFHYNVPLEQIVNHIPYGYIDRDGYQKTITKLSKLCGASPANNQILFFYGHYSHFDDGALIQMMCKNIQPFELKSVDSINEQPNDNGLNARLKSLYNVEKSEWMLKYGTM